MRMNSSLMLLALVVFTSSSVLLQVALAFVEKVVISIQREAFAKSGL